MDVVEVCYRSGHCNIHGANFPHQSLQFILAHPEYSGRDVEKLKEFQVFSLWEGDCAGLRANQPPQNLFYADQVALACYQLIDSDGILGFSKKG